MKFKGIWKYSVFSLTFLCLVTFANTSNAAIDCINDPLDTQAKKDYCEEILKQKEAEAKKLEEEAKKEQQNQQSISAEINKLNSEISNLKGNISKKTSMIQSLSKQISSRVSKISTLEEKIAREKVSLSKILRKQYETDSFTIFELLLSGETISNFLSDTQAFAYVQDSLQDSFNTIRTTQKVASEEKQKLESEKTEEEIAKYELEQNKKAEELKKSQKDYALSLSEQNEKDYWAMKASREAEAAIIRNKLFPLVGITGGGIPFGTALEYANLAFKSTGVRPALILAILKQESNLGANVGQCYLKDETGTSVGINTGTVFPNGMKSTRDVQPFLAITKKLGLNSYKTPISCPIAGHPEWYGGAMGPSQFIPSTWVLFEERIKSIVGSNPNPWDAYHAVTATALYLKDLGAAGGGSAETNAACRYFGQGAGCSYGKQVAQHILNIQKDIDALEL